MEFWEQIGAGGLVIGALTFLAKSLFTKFIEQDQDRFRANLQHEYDRTLQAYRSELEKERLKFEIQYGGIFRQQAEAILKLWILIDRLNTATGKLSQYSEDDHDLFVEWGKAYDASSQHITENEILFDAETADLAKKLVARIATALEKHYSIASATNIENPNMSLIADLRRAWYEAGMEIGPLQTLLKTRFRTLIGTHIDAD